MLASGPRVARLQLVVEPLHAETTSDDSVLRIFPNWLPIALAVPAIKSDYGATARGCLEER